MSQPMRPVRRVSVVDEVVEYLTRRIISGEWPPGTVVPSLRALAEDAGVSTLTVREAIRTLQARGLLETRHGVGTFVTAPSEDEKVVPWMLGASDVDEYVDLIEAREVIETAIVRLAAERRTEEQVAVLSEILDRMRAARLDSATYLEADTDFHIALAEASHNVVLLRSMLAIRGPLRRLMATRNLHHLTEHGSLDKSIAAHEDILTAIKEQRSAKGEAALRDIAERAVIHLESIKE